MTQKSSADLIKTEANLERLTSLATVRDLSLGGRGRKPKRVYAPNLNAARKYTTQAKGLRSESNHSRKEKTGIRLLRTRKPDAKRFVQSVSGVFSEGTSVEIHKPKSNRFLYNSEVGIGTPKTAVKTESKPVLRKAAKKPWNRILDNDTLHLDSRDKKTCRDHTPIFLPLHLNSRPFHVNVSCVADTQTGVMQEPEPPQYCSAFASLCTASNENPILSIIKLPDQLPVLTGATNRGLLDVKEGRIGKLLVRESGKLEMHIGSQCFLMDTVDKAAFSEIVMSVPTKEGIKVRKEGIAEIGVIRESYVVSPDWDHLIIK